VDTLGERLRHSREQLHLSQGELAAEIEVNVSVISRIERGRIDRPTTATLHRLAYALEVDPCWLRDGDESADRDASTVPFDDDQPPEAIFPTTIQQRLAAVAQSAVVAPPGAPPASMTLAPPAAFQVATLTTDDGRHVATLSCHEELGEITIGRGREAQIRLADASASRIHATLCWDATVGAHVVRDAGSVNGLRVDGQRVRDPIALRHGARLTLGRTTLCYTLR
jgi:transcriptional regulator with XRE-family HTH domain